MEGDNRLIKIALAEFVARCYQLRESLAALFLFLSEVRRMNIRSILWTATIAIVAVALVNNIGMTRGIVTPATPRF